MSKYSHVGGYIISIRHIRKLKVRVVHLPKAKRGKTRI